MIKTRHPMEIARELAEREQAEREQAELPLTHQATLSLQALYEAMKTPLIDRHPLRRLVTQAMAMEVQTFSVEELAAMIHHGGFAGYYTQDPQVVEDFLQQMHNDFDRLDLSVDLMMVALWAKTPIERAVTMGADL